MVLKFLQMLVNRHGKKGTMNHNPKLVHVKASPTVKPEGTTSKYNDRVEEAIAECVREVLRKVKEGE